MGFLYNLAKYIKKNKLIFSQISQKVYNNKLKSFYLIITNIQNSKFKIFYFTNHQSNKHNNKTMSSWFTNSSATPEWKTFINLFQQMKLQQNIKQQQIQYINEPHLLPTINNIQIFFNSVSIILNELKSYNNEVIDYIRNNLPLLIKQSIRIILQLPQQQRLKQSKTQLNVSSTSTQSTLSTQPSSSPSAAFNNRKHKWPLQALQFIEGVMYLPNIFNINYLKQELYYFYCSSIVHYFKGNLQIINKSINNEDYKHSIYKNYFFRLFQLPYAVVECETRIGANYASMTMSVASSQSNKKQSFLECLIAFLQKNPQTLDLLVSNISSQAILNCLSKILMTNGMFNFPFALKEIILKKLFDIKKKYIEYLSNTMNGKASQANFRSEKQEIQIHIENILDLECSIVNRSANIYDGIKLFEFIGNLDNVKDIVYLSSVNVVWTNRNQDNKPLISSFVQQHLSELLLSIVHKDTMLYKSSSPTIQIQPKISLKDINFAIQPLLLSIKQLLSEKVSKPQIKHLNLIKILYVMILNRQKYQIVDNLVIKNNILCLLVEICKKYHQLDILVNSIFQIFRSIFKSEINLLILPSNAANVQEIKNSYDLIEQKITAQAFKAADLILSLIKTMKSHKDSLFGQFFKLAKVIKQFSRNFFSTIQCSSSMDVDFSIKNENSISLNTLIEPLYRNQFIKRKSKEWQDFYLANFLQLQNNYLRDLGKFQEFDKAPLPAETKYTIIRFGDQKQVTNSQMIHNKAQVQTTINNSIQILSHTKQAQKQQQANQNPATNFKKDKNRKLQDIENQNQQNQKQTNSQLIAKQDIQITSEPIKIQFKKKKTSVTEQSDSANDQASAQEGQQSFKSFMKKKLDQITTQNRENTRKKSKTPTKFKSTDGKTPPKIKKWNDTQPEELPNAKNIPKQLISAQKQLISSQPLNKKNSSEDSKFQRLNNKATQPKPLPIKIIMVGKKTPKIYKERDLDSKGRDSRLIQWIRG